MMIWLMPGSTSIPRRTSNLARIKQEPGRDGAGGNYTDDDHNKA
jgi:hypothetical protein